MRLRKSLLTPVVMGGAFVIAVFFAGSELFILPKLYNAESVKETLPRLAGEAMSGEMVLGLEVTKRLPRKSSLSEPEVDRSAGSRIENGMESPHLKATMAQLATDIDVGSGSSKSKFEESRNSALSTKPAGILTPRNETTSPKGDIDSKPISRLAENEPAPNLKATDARSPLSIVAQAASGIEVLPSTPSQAEANDVFLALVVHFTGKRDRLKAVTSTWLKRTHPRMAFLIFTSEKNMAFMNSTGIPTVYYPENDTETDHTVQAIRSAISMFPNAVYISKSDDDAYVYMQRLAYTLFSNAPYNYQGLKCPAQHGRFRLGPDFIYACGGHGYTLTRYAAEKLVSLSNPPQHDFEDVGVGLRLKHALGNEFGLYKFNMHWDDSRYKWREQPQYGAPLTHHHITPPVMYMMHEETYYWRPGIRRAPVPRIFHHLESEPIDPSCTKVNPKWKIMTWTTQKIQALSRRSRNDSAFVQYDVLYRHGGIYLTSNDTCKQPLDARLDRFAKDFEHDGYYLAYDFHEHGFRSGLFVMRPFSDASNSLRYFAEWNLSSHHPVENLKSSRINVAVLPATGLFERG